MRRCGLALAVLLASDAAHAQDDPYSTTVEAPPEPGEPGRPSSRVDRDDLEERQPRSAPDALRWEPGVYVQQTSAGQGSPYLRGRTGQQTLLLFDGIRLNHSLFRQGPNQYFFTVDWRSIAYIDVTRGGASTRWGSDAIGGVLDARPIEPAPGRGGAGWRPGAQLRLGSADDETALRLETHGRLGAAAIFGGVGVRRVGLLESGGALRSPETGAPPLVPFLEDDGRTQRGTGFDEVAGDLRVVVPVGGGELTAAVYDYRQLDAPRTDQCPPPLAPLSECLTIEEQYRTLAYLAWARRGKAGRARVTLSWQRQHERRRRDRLSSNLENGGRDDVSTAGATAVWVARPRPLGAGARGAPAAWHWRWRAGADAYHDRVDSTAWIIFTDVDFVTVLSRGQYLAGSRYTTGGVFADAAADWRGRVILRAGARAGWAGAYAPGDPESSSAAIDASWPSWVGHTGVEWRVRPAFSLLADVDRSLRAPNLDDLTARQSVGPGYQFENPALGPETALAFEIGARWHDRRVDAETWVYRSGVDDAIARVPRGVADCPPGDAGCAASANRFQLVNLGGTAVIVGAEAALGLRLAEGFGARAVVSAARGEDADGVPLSRVPPLSGSVELRRRWPGAARFTLGGALRWARTQDRLALADRADARIPQGGTPGFAVVDLRAGLRLGRGARLDVVVENVADMAYRYHGSSVNGPGRGIMVSLALE